jgi:hypothetical protein
MMNTDWRTRRIRERRQLPPITIRTHAADVLTTKLLQLEMIYRHGTITPTECDQLEALRAIADAAAWVRDNTKTKNTHIIIPENTALLPRIDRSSGVEEELLE